MACGTLRGSGSWPRFGTRRRCTTRLRSGTSPRPAVPPSSGTTPNAAASSRPAAARPTMPTPSPSPRTPTRATSSSTSTRRLPTDSAGRGSWGWPNPDWPTSSSRRISTRRPTCTRRSTEGDSSRFFVIPLIGPSVCSIIDRLRTGNRRTTRPSRRYHSKTTPIRTAARRTGWSGCWSTRRTAGRWIGAIWKSPRRSSGASSSWDSCPTWPRAWSDSTGISAGTIPPTPRRCSARTS
mmetsp:Transcript_17300/g.41000  ORF Transcript_17300/g.41000 Transcript_17300/m.41000 type:complete len:237 (+) Transcript_17300:682-1392(+)